MKKILSVLITAVLLANLITGSVCTDAAAAENICLNKPVICSSRLQYNELYPHNLTNGNRALRASSYYIDLDNPYEWFRINLNGSYMISQISVYTSGNITPSNLAVDIWSGGKWVRVVRDYNISAADYPRNYYFGEIDASYIQISTNGIPNAPSQVPQDAYAFSLSEVEAYHNVNASEDKKTNLIEDIPSGENEIPMPEDISLFLFKQGLKTDPSVCPYIPENELNSPAGQYELSDYSAADIKYLKAIYRNAKYTGNTISMAGSARLKSE